jgi:hypothetical protein
MGGCKAFHYNGKYDERCGAQRFVDHGEHGLVTARMGIPPSRKTQAPGAFLGVPRLRTAGTS